MDIFTVTKLEPNNEFTNNSSRNLTGTIQKAFLHLVHILDTIQSKKIVSS